LPAGTGCISRASADGRGRGASPDIASPDGVPERRQLAYRSPLGAPPLTDQEMHALQTRFAELLGRNLDASERSTLPTLDAPLARKLLARLDAVPLFAHAYTHLMNFTHGTFRPVDLLDFAYRHELSGVCIHLADGEERSLGRANDATLQAVAAHARRLGLAVHLEISSTAREEVDHAIHVARVMGVRHLRVYSRYEGLLSAVMARVSQDLRYLAAQADLHDLHIHFEQHEELKSAEIAALLTEIAHPRLWALFDCGNMINAAEQPLDALRTLAPWIRQAHLKGVHILPEGPGNGHRGVLQGSAEDDLPVPRMLFELLMLGEDAPQVLALALEQENYYYAPMFRHREEPTDPFIPYREMSETTLPEGMSMQDMLEGEPRWASNQVRVVRSILQELRWLAECSLLSADKAAATP
jgi:sugar phosphate isomerase/epimerase